MHSEHRFLDLAESFKNGFLLDDIVLALARAEKGQALGDGDRKLLGQAALMLASAEVGFRWVDKPELTTETRSAATFFARAVNALPAVHAPEAFLRNISDLKATATDLSTGATAPPPEKIRLLRTFFYNTAQSELGRTEQLLEGEGSIEVLKWTAIRE